METSYEVYNKYLNFLLRVECSKQHLDFDATVKRLVETGRPPDPEPLKISAEVSEPDQKGLSIISITATGGMPPYEGAGDFEVGPGSHTYRLTDSNGQSGEVTAVANAPAVKKPQAKPLKVTAQVSEPNREGLSIVCIEASGGEPPYQGTGEFEVSPGKYSYTITDNSGQHKETTVTAKEQVVIAKELPVSPYNLEFPDGYYIGDTSNGQMHGVGTRFWNNGKKAEGNWIMGKASGHILITINDDLLYEGEMVESGRHGKGKFVYPNGQVYVGGWISDNKEGEGRLLNDNGDKIYEGEWKDDKYNGYGQFFMRGVCRYEGNWENGKKNGEGIAYDENGHVEYNGRWQDNQRLDEPDTIETAANSIDT
jgi:hypothetical protein